MRLRMEHALVRERPVSAGAKRLIAEEHDPLWRDGENGYVATGDRAPVALPVRAGTNRLAVVPARPRAPNPRVGAHDVPLRRSRCRSGRTDLHEHQERGQSPETAHADAMLPHEPRGSNLARVCDSRPRPTESAAHGAVLSRCVVIWLDVSQTRSQCARHDSNMRPLPPQGSALSPELRARGTEV